MTREKLIANQPTAQVRLLAEELLEDGYVHTRKEIEEYVVVQGEQMGLPIFRQGHLAGGIRQATTNMNCKYNTSFKCNVSLSRGRCCAKKEAKNGRLLAAAPRESHPGPC